MSFTRRALERRALTPSSWGLQLDPAAIPPNSMTAAVAAGVHVNERTALQLMTVMRCVQVLAGDASGLPIDAYRRIGGGRHRRQWLDPMPFLDDPFAEIRPSDGWFRMFAAAVLRGNAYGYILDRDRLQLPTPGSILPLHPDKVRCYRRGGRLRYDVNGTTVPTEDIWHVRGFTLPGADVGLSAIEYGAQALGLAIAAEAYGAQYFAQGTVVSGVLATEQTLDEPAVRRLAKRLAKRHGGLRNAHLPLVLDAGLKWQPLTVAPNEAQFLETRGYGREDIAGFFGVPLDRVGGIAKHASQGGGKGADSRSLDYVKYSLRFWLTRFEDALYSLLPNDIRAEWNVDALLRGDRASRYAGYSQARAGSWMTVNDIREDDGQEPLDDPRANDLFSPLNSATGGDTTASGEPRDSDPED